MPEDIQAAAAQPSDDIPASTAAHQAVSGNNFSAFREASRAERAGKPLAPTPAGQAPAETDPKPAADGPLGAQPKGTDEQRSVSKRQLQINDLHRQIAEQNAEIARLKTPAQAAAARSDAPAAKADAPKAEKFPAFEAYLATKPDASFEDWMEARDDWRDGRKAAAAREQQEAVQSTRGLQAQVNAFNDKLSKELADEADPKAFLASIEPKLLDAPPISALPKGATPTFSNFLAEQILHSEHPKALLKHLSDVAVVKQLVALPSANHVLRAIARFEAGLAPAKTDESAEPQPKTVTDAPAPPTTFGSKSVASGDPSRAAVASGNFSAFRAAERAKLSVGRR